MKYSRSALDNQRLNATRRKRGTRYALVRENEHYWVSRGLKKVTLCSRILLVKEAEGACHQRSTGIPGERRTVIADPQPAFPFDRNNDLVRVRVDRWYPLSFHPPLCFAIVAHTQLWLANNGVRRLGSASSLTARDRQNGWFDRPRRRLTYSAITGIGTQNKDSGRDI